MFLAIIQIAKINKAYISEMVFSVGKNHVAVGKFKYNYSHYCQISNQ